MSKKVRVAPVFLAVAVWLVTISVTIVFIAALLALVEA